MKFQPINLYMSCFLSRPESDIQYALSKVPTLCLLPHHIESDMEKYVDSEFAKLPRLAKMPATVRDDLRFNPVKHADGMFRWLSCQIDTLRKVRTVQALEDALQSLSLGLNETYDRILHSIDDCDHVYVFRILRWLIGADRPLSVKELAEAIALNPNKAVLDLSERLMIPEDVFDLYGSLIRVDENNHIVLAHLSVKEYLLSTHLAAKENKIASFALKEDHCKRHISMCLLSYAMSVGLRIRGLKKEMLDEDEFPSFSYTRMTGPERFGDFEAMNAWMKMHLFTKELGDPEWLGLLDFTRPPAPATCNCHIARGIRGIIQWALLCYCNGHMQHIAPSKTPEPVQLIAQHLLKAQRAFENPVNAAVNIRYYSVGALASSSPLCAAASLNFEHVLTFLVHNGSDVDGITKLDFLGAPLLRALFYGRKEVAKLLIDLGARVNIRCLWSDHGFPLAAAASHSTELVEFLLEWSDVNVDMVDAFGRTIVSHVPKAIAYTDYPSIIGLYMTPKSGEH